MKELDELVLKYALQNAVNYHGKASSGAVIGKVLAERPDLKPRAKEISEIVARIVNEINSMSSEKQREKLSELAPDMLQRERREKDFKLPPLQNVGEKVVMRFAPNPSGPLHIGHSRVAVLNDDYVRRYGGEYINRFEDTDPDRIDPEAYDFIEEDLDWLEIEISNTYYQSDRFEIYYEIGLELLKKGHGYVCTCLPDDWRKLKENRSSCPHRDAKSEDQLFRWEELFDGTYQAQQASFIVKTDLNDPNPALRDFVGLRIDDTPHPRTGTKYRVYPLMNFSVAVDDHLMNLTHVIRGKDHLNNTYRQVYIFNYMGWKKPEYVHYGRVRIEGPELKTSAIRAGIDDGKYTGWDDIRLGTLRALKRRGIRAKALREYWLRAGISEVDVEFSWDTLFSLNKELVDSIAKRYFFVSSPVKLSIEGIDHIEGRAPLHPNDETVGFREYSLNRPIDLYVSKEDIEGSYKVRLKDLCNVEIVDNKGLYKGNDLSAIKQGYKIIHWVPMDSIPMTLLMPDGNHEKGFGERKLSSQVGTIVQLERVGFVRIESANSEIFAVFAHK